MVSPSTFVECGVVCGTRRLICRCFLVGMRRKLNLEGQLVVKYTKVEQGRGCGMT